TQARTLLFAIDRNDDRVQVEQETAGWLWNNKQLSTQTIMKADQLPNGCWRKSLEEATKRGLIGEAVQTEQIEEGPVVLENFSFVDPSQSGDDSVEQSQEQVSRPI